MSAKLPHLELPKFDGSLLKWQEFWDSFSAAIDDNPCIKPVDKFNYLKSNLEGKAKQIVEGLQLTNANYKIAVKLLKERFGNRQLIVKSYYSALRDISVCPYEPAKLQTTHNKIEKLLRSLEALGENIENSLLVSLIISKLPAEVRFELSKHKKPDEMIVERISFEREASMVHPNM